MLVDHDALDQAQAGGQLAHTLLRRSAAGTERNHVLGQNAGSRRGAADGHTALISLRNSIPKGRSGDQGTELELVTARHEDAAHLPQRLDKVRLRRLRATLWTQRNDFPSAERGKDVPVDLDNFSTE